MKCYRGVRTDDHRSFGFEHQSSGTIALSRNFSEIDLGFSHCAASHEMPDQRNHGDNQQGMDQSAGHMEHDPAKDPADQEYEKEREKHENLR
jgi:hypothetical protein